MSINTHEKCNSIPTDFIPIQQKINHSSKYLSRHKIKPSNKTIIQNLDDYIKQQPYHIHLLISNYTLNTKSDSLLECITNNISLYISIDGAREEKSWGGWLIAIDTGHESFMGTTLITDNQKTYIRIDLKCIHLLYHFYSSIYMQNSSN